MSDTDPYITDDLSSANADAASASRPDRDAAKDHLPSSNAPAPNSSVGGDAALTTPAAEEATLPADDPYEGATPPGYDEWPTHGGYLGCLMGVVLALVLAPVGYILFGLIGAALFRPLGYAGVWLAGAITVVVYLACFVGLVRLGWRLGKSFYREYPRPAWQTASSSFEAPVEGRRGSLRTSGAPAQWRR